MRPALRKLVLAVHIGLSVGWLGAVAAYLVLDIAVNLNADPILLRAAYLAMDLVARLAIVPLAIGALLSGLIVAGGTKWGLFDHWWVVISLILTVLATVVLLVELRAIGQLGALAADPATSNETLRSLRSSLPHSIGGALVLSLVLVLNVYKPAGLTPLGWRRRSRRRS